ncbi:MAG: Na+/H+ antiporter subunit E [Myxococcales bacterium]|nr:Na+/H+ antiporter subunit E [Myxococcales bacterium]
MSRLIIVVSLTVVWAALFATTDWRGMAFGALISALIVSFSGKLEHTLVGPLHRSVMPRPLGIVLLSWAFVVELWKSAVAVAIQAWKPRIRLRPGVVKVPLTVSTDVEITVLASLVSLTPGTLSLEVSRDGKALFIHALDIPDQGEATRRAVREKLERPVKRAFRVQNRQGRATSRTRENL